MALNGQMLNFINYYQSELKELKVNHGKKLKIDAEKEFITSPGVEVDSWCALSLISLAK